MSRITSEYKNSPYIGARIEFAKELVRKTMCKYRGKKPNKETRYKSTTLQKITYMRKARHRTQRV